MLRKPFPKEVDQFRVHFVRMVQVMQCGPSFTTNRRAPLISLAIRSPEAVIGRIRSASPFGMKPRPVREMVNSAQT